MLAGLVLPTSCRTTTSASGRSSAGSVSSGCRKRSCTRIGARARCRSAQCRSARLRSIRGLEDRGAAQWSFAARAAGTPRCTGARSGVLVGGRAAPRRRGSPDKLSAKWPLIGGAAALAVGAALFTIDEDPGHRDSHGNVTKYYLKTAPLGVALGVAGLASVGVGVWRWRHGLRSSSAPIVSMTSSRTMFGWTGQF